MDNNSVIYLDENHIMTTDEWSSYIRDYSFDKFNKNLKLAKKEGLSFVKQYVYSSDEIESLLLRVASTKMKWKINSYNSKDVLEVIKNAIDDKSINYYKILSDNEIIYADFYIDILLLIIDLSEVNQIVDYIDNFVLTNKLSFVFDPKSDLIVDNFYFCSMPPVMITYIIDKYYNYNPTNILKIGKFDFNFDGHMSKVVSTMNIVKDSERFTSENYPLKEQFKLEVEEIVSKLVDRSNEISKSNDFDNILNLVKNEDWVNNRFSYEHAIIIMLNLLNSSSGNVNSLIKNIKFSCTKSPIISKFPALLIHKNLIGINSILFAFFSGYVIVPYEERNIDVHKNFQERSIFSTYGSVFLHDIGHVKDNQKFENKCVDYGILKCVYSYILNNQEKIGIEKSKGLLIGIYFRIHEGVSRNGSRLGGIITESFHDTYYMFKNNGYYTPKRYNIGSNFLENEIEGVRYLTTAVKEILEDLTVIEDIIIKDIGKFGPNVS